MGKLKELKGFLAQDNTLDKPEEMLEWLDWCYKELDQIHMLAWQAQEAAIIIAVAGAPVLIKECHQLIEEVDEEGISKEEFLAREQKVWDKLNELFDAVGNHSEYVRLYGAAQMDIGWRKEYEFKEDP